MMSSTGNHPLSKCVQIVFDVMSYREASIFNKPVQVKRAGMGTGMDRECVMDASKNWAHKFFVTDETDRKQTGLCFLRLL